MVSDQDAGARRPNPPSARDRLIGWLRLPASPARVVVDVNPPAPDVPSAERLYFEIARSRLDVQLVSIESINARASAMFAIGSTVLPITASLLSIERVNVLDQMAARGALGVGCLFYVALVVAFVLSYRLGGLQARPDLEQWQEITVGRTEEEMFRWLGDAYVEAHLSNRHQLRKKATQAGVMVWVLAGEAIALTVAVVAPIL